MKRKVIVGLLPAVGVLAPSIALVGAHLTAQQQLQ